MKYLIKNVNMVDVEKNEIRQTDIAIEDEIFGQIASGIKQESGQYEVIDAEGLYALPGLIDAHSHVELSLLSSVPLAEAIMEKGTVAAVLDPHDAVNVLGAKGAKYLMDEMETTQFTPVWMASPCVPSAPEYEDCFGQIMLKDVKTMIEDYGMYGIAETMDYNRVIKEEKTLKQILEYAQNKNLMIDGHAPCVVGDDLNKYIGSGVSSDHESVSVEEMTEKFQKGMTVIIRRGSLKEPASAKEFLEQVGESERILLSTDGCITVQDILNYGHMNYALSQIVKEGVEPVLAVKMATLYPAKRYGLKNLGSIQKGKIASLVLVKDLEDFHVEKVFVKGEIVKRTGTKYSFDNKVLNSICHDNMTDRELMIEIPEDCKQVKANIVTIIDGTLETKKTSRVLTVENEEIHLPKDVMYCSVTNRYEKNGSTAVGLVDGVGKFEGAIAGSIGQDTQNLIAIGSNLYDMKTALNKVIKEQGGVALAAQGKNIDFLELPVMGIMSQKPIEVFTEELERLYREIKDMGMTLMNPLLTLSLQISLAVIPEMAITNRGVLDVNNNQFISVLERIV